MRIGFSNALSLVCCMAALLSGARGVAQEKVLHNFGNVPDGATPDSSLIFDAAGNLYGTTAGGGGHGYGTVFELTPVAGRGWSEKILHNFNHDGVDGESPAAGLVMDSVGNLYGTTFDGGAFGYGTAFEIKLQAGNWTEEILHSFNNNGSDGYWPYARLILDASGNLYGTTYGGGPNGGGTAFELVPAARGPWQEMVLHAFSTTGGDGFYPEAELIFDSAGNLYGTTYEGGSSAYGGTVFELSPDHDGQWTETVLRNCNSADGWGPRSGVILDSAGNLYGSTQYLGTAASGGTVFELTPAPDGTWTNRVLQNFTSSSDGTYPFGPVLDAVGNLYGAANHGGTYGAGVVFKLSSNKRGTEKILLNFDGKGGYGPSAGVILDRQGNLYGTASAGGAYGSGVVFEITP